MKRYIACSAIAAFLCIATIPALADSLTDQSTNQVGRANSAESKVRMIVTRDYKAKEARLEIPRSVWQKLQAEAGGPGQQSALPVGRSLNLSAVQTAIAGLFLSLALVFAGMWLVRARSRVDQVTRTALGVAALALLGAAGSAVYANAGPPPAASRSLTTAALAPEVRNWGVSGEVTVSIGDDDRPIILYLPDKK